MKYLNNNKNIGYLKPDEMLKALKKLIGQKLANTFYRKEGRLNMNGPVITFSFDDFPESAYTQALPILDKYGIKATFYVAMGLEGGESYGEPLFSTKMVADLHKKKHEIASHTFAHVRCTSLNSKDLIADLHKNNEALRTITGFEPENFSYPFGEVSTESKKVVSKKFNSARGITPGINNKQIDLNLLRANKLYHTIPVNTVLALIEQNKKEKGWLILYTHDVRAKPSNFGCTPEYFETVVKAAVESGAQILTVNEVIKFVQKQ